MLIVIEGGDGSGKTTLAYNISRWLECTVQHFPDRTTVTGHAINRMLKTGIEPLEFQVLQLANRHEKYAMLKSAKGSWNKHVICVRYWQSGWVYGALDGLDKRWLFDIHEGLPSPDLSLLLDIPAAVLEERRKKRGEPDEAYEAQRKDKEINALYRELWDTHGWLKFDSSEGAEEFLKVWIKKQ